jgi:hypothetical protein
MKKLITEGEKMRNKILICLVLSVVVTGLTATITSAASIVG